MKKITACAPQEEETNQNTVFPFGTEVLVLPAADFKFQERRVCD